MSKTTRTTGEPNQPTAPGDPFALPSGHHMGRDTGFDKRGDAIYAAPSLVAPMEEIRLERVALQAFVDAINAHVLAQFKRIVAAEQEWWERVERDIGVKRGEAEYRYFEHCFRKKQEKP